MAVAVKYNDPDSEVTGEESVEFTFWFTLDGTLEADDVCDRILALLESTQIEGVKYQQTFRSPFAKLYSA